MGQSGIRMIDGPLSALPRSMTERGVTTGGGIDRMQPDLVRS